MAQEKQMEVKMQFTFFVNMTMQRFNELTEHMI
jgi:hypothetical protein